MKFWHSITEFCFTIWVIKYRLMLLFLIGLAGYAHYREYENVLLAVFNSVGVLGLSVVKAKLTALQGE